MKLLTALALLLCSCAINPSGEPVTLVRASVATTGSGGIWTDGLALVAYAPELEVGIESKAPDVFPLPPELPGMTRTVGRAVAVRLYPYEVRVLALDEPWPAWTRGALPPELIDELELVFEEPPAK